MSYHQRFSLVRLFAVTMLFLGAVGIFCPVASAVVRTWDGGGVGGTDFGTAVNWSGDTLPNPATPDEALFDGTVAGALSLNYSNTGFNGAAGNAGVLVHLASTQTSPVTIDESGTGSIRISGITIDSGAGALTWGNGSTPALTFTMGGAASTQTFTNNSANAATFGTESVFNTGGAGAHTYAFTGSGDWVVNSPITNSSGTVTLTKSGTGALTLAGSNTYSGNTTVSAGTLNLTGSLSHTATSQFNVTSTTDIPVANITGTLSLTNTAGGFGILIANAAGNSKGVVNQNGGTVSIGSNVILGGASSASNYAYYNMTGGTLTHTGANRFRIGQSAGAGSAALFNLSSGTATTTVGIGLNDTSGAIVGPGGAAGLYISGGSMSSTNGTAGSTTAMGLGIGGRGGQSEVTIAGSGTMTLNGFAQLGGSVAGTPAAADAGRVAVLNLGTGTAGGSLQTSMVSQNATAGALPTGYLNFNGGTLRAQTANTTFLTALTQATVHSGGGTIDNNGAAITIGQNLIGATGNGLASIGVSGATGYKGAPYVQITGGGTPTTPATAVANLDGSGNVTSITITNPGTGYTSTPTITLVGGGGTAGTLTPALGAVSSGGMTFQGSGTTTLTGNSSYGGGTTVISGTLAVNGSLTGSLSVNGGTLDGTGTVGAVTIANGSGIANGAGVANDLAMSSLSFGGSATTGIKIAQATPFAPGIAVSGALTTTPANGQVTINASTDTGFWPNGTINLIGYGTFTGGSASNFSLNLSTPLTNRQSNGGLSVGGGFVSMTINGDSPKWTGADNNNWAPGLNGTNKNWKLITGNTSTDYIDTDIVLFDDSVGAGPTAVDIGSSVSPSSTEFNNSTHNYSVSSANNSSILTGTLTKKGTGSLTINTFNSFTGGTTFNGGTLNLGNSAALGNGTFTIAAGNAKTLDNTTGSALTLSTITSQAWNDDFVFAGAADNTHDLDTGTGAVTLGGTGTDRTVTVGGASTLSVGELRAPAQGLIKQGTGTLLLTSTGPNGGANGSIISGVLNVAAGTVQINRTDGDGGDAATGDLAVGGLTGVGTIVNGSNDTRWLFVNTTGNYNFSGTLANGNGSNTADNRLGFVKQGSGTQTLSGANSYTDVTTVAAGTLIISGSNSGDGTPTTINPGATLVLATPTTPLGAAALVSLTPAGTSTVSYATDGGDTAYTFTMSSGTTFNVVLDRATTGANVTHNMSTAASGSGFGSGTINFTRGANVSGTATASFDALNLGGGGGGSTVIAPGAGTNVVIGTSTKSNNNVSQTLELGGVSTGNLVTGVISNGVAAGANSIALAKSNTSTWTISGNNTYTGGTTINGGTLFVSNTTGSGTGTGAVTVNGGTLGGTGTINTTSTVTINNGGNLSPGASAGTLTMSATGGINLSAMGAGALKFDLGTPEVAGADNDNDSDHLKVTAGTLTLGQLDFSDFGFTELPGIAAGTYTLIDAASTMAATLGTATGSIPGFTATLSMDNTTTFDVTLTLTATGTPGDFNGDTKVNLADYVSWRKNDGTNAGYASFRQNFSVGPANGSSLSSAGSAVPEPQALVLVGLGCFALASTRKLRRGLRREAV